MLFPSITRQASLNLKFIRINAHTFIMFDVASKKARLWEGTFDKMYPNDILPEKQIIVIKSDVLVLKLRTFILLFDPVFLYQLKSPVI